MDRSKCEGCPLVEHMYMEEIALGDEVHYLVVTDAPSRSNALRQRLLSPSASDVLSRHLDALGFDKKHFAFVPQVRCVFDPDTLPTKEKRQIAKQCRAHLLDTVELYKPSVVIPIGSDATNQTVGKSVQITKVRGLAEYHQELDAVVLPMLHPGFVARYPQHIATFAADCNSLARLVDNGLDTSISVLDSGVTYSFVEDLQFLVDMEPEVLFFDTETTGLEFFKKGNASVRRYDPTIHGKEFAPNPAILTMQFCVRPGEAYMLVWDHPENPIPQRRKPKLVQQLIQLLSNPNTLVIGQNSTFDSRFMRACTGVKYEIGGDTLMLAALVDENAMSKGQDTLVKQYVPDMAGYADRFNSQYDKSRMWEVPLDELLMYGCGDVDTGLRLYDVLIRIVEKDDLLTAQYQYVSMPGINTFVDVEMEGIYIDHDALSVFQRVMEETVEEEYRALLDQVPKSIQRKHIDKGLKFTRADFLLDILFNHPDGFRLRPQVFTKSTAKLPASLRVPSTSSKDHLPYFYESCPFTEQLASYIKNERLLSTNVKGFSNKYIHDGKVRPTYKLWTVVTGRSACVKDDTPIVTLRGIVRANEIVVGDMVWTHRGRWRPVTELFRKPDEVMYSLHLSNGEVLTSTGEHKVLLFSGEWSTVSSLLVEGDDSAIPMQSPSKEQKTIETCSGDVPDAVSDYSGGSGLPRCQSSYCQDNDRKPHSGGCVQSTETHSVSEKQTRGEEPTVRARVGVRLRGGAGVPYTAGRGEEVLCSSDSVCRVHGGSRVLPTGHFDYTPHRREPEEQQYRELGSHNGSWAPENTREVSEPWGGLTIEKVVCAGVHRVYDFQVDEDHSYLSCGVFSHNSENPNGQNFPKRGPNAKAYRRSFVAPKGWVVIEADESQAELRIAADMANERTMISIYNSGGDIHISTALIVMGISMAQFLELPKAEQKAARQKAKAVNFGFIYGMGWRKFIGYAKTQYGVEFSEDEARRIREAFFSLYSGLAPWHDRMRAFATEHKFVRSYSGRVRHLPMIDSDDEMVRSEAGRQAINSPVQNFGSDLGIISMAAVRQDIDPAYLHPIAFVHDAIFCYAREEYAMWAAGIVKYYMETNPLEEMFGRVMKVPLIADVSVGRNFGDTYELAGFTDAESFDVSSLWNEETQSGILLPPQKIPPMNGRRVTPLYSTCS